MNTETLKAIWQQVFNSTPQQGIIDAIADWLAGEPNPSDAERILFYFLMKS